MGEKSQPFLDSIMAPLPQTFIVTFQLITTWIFDLDHAVKLVSLFCGLVLLCVQVENFLIVRAKRRQMLKEEATALLLEQNKTTKL